MHLPRCNNTLSFAGRAALILATFAQIPQISSESQAECEAIAIVARDTATAVEQFRTCAQQSRTEVHSRLQRRGVAQHPPFCPVGHRLSATLLAPLRC